MFRRATKLTSSVPVGAAKVAMTSAAAGTSILLGRRSSSKTTAQVTKSASRNVHTWMLHQNHHRQTHAMEQSFYKTMLTSYNNNSSNLMTKTTTATTRAFSAAKTSFPKQNSASTSAASANNNNNNAAKKTSSSSFVEWYEGHLESRPIQTKMVTGSLLWGLGDFVAQVVPVMFFEEKEAMNKQEGSITSSSSPSSSSHALVYDYTRTARAMFYGFAIHAPLSHTHYNFLEWMTVRGGFTGLSIPLFKAFMEQVCNIYCSIVCTGTAIT